MHVYNIKWIFFQIDSKPLALAIAQEWNCQGKKIDMNLMRLTGLIFTAIDNPNLLIRFVVNFICIWFFLSIKWGKKPYARISDKIDDKCKMQQPKTLLHQPKTLPEMYTFGRIKKIATTELKN